MINTGKMLLEYLEANNLTKVAFGKRIGRNSLSVLKYTRNTSMRTDMLLQVCHAAQHNFFQDIADQLPTYYSKKKIEDKSSIEEKEQLIQQLQDQIKELTIKNEILMKVSRIE